MILQAEQLRFRYPEAEEDALCGVSLSVERGKKTVVMGANGSGKSTFFLCCMGICKPQSGVLRVNGTAVTYHKKGLKTLRSTVGMVFQDPDQQIFCSDITQEISFGILNQGICEQQARQQVQSMIERLGIAPFQHQPTHMLSGGQKKLVCIADILVMNPELVILDEPAAALDPKHQKLVWEIVQQMTEQGITVLISTHDVNEAYEWADEVIVFDHGTVLMQGTPEQIFTNTQLLEQTHLEQPFLLKTFFALQKKGVLSAQCPIPRTLEQLTQLQFCPSTG